jgi:hypothetical protein
MKKGLLTALSTVCVCIVACIYISIRTSSHDMRIEYAFDPLLSAYAHDKITECLAQVDMSKGVHHIKQIIQTSLPTITHIDQQRLDNHTYILKFHAEPPCVRTTQKLLITADGQCCAERLYTADAYAALPCVTVLTRDRRSLRTCARWVAHVPRSFFENYTIQWKDHTSILLQDKMHPGVWIQCTAATTPRDDELNICATCTTQAGLKLKKNQVCVCDIRFRKQIIVRPMMLGGA